MLQLERQTVIWFLIISCIALTWAVNEQLQVQQQHSGNNILPGKYHAYTQQQQQQQLKLKQKQQNTKKLHIVGVAKTAAHLQQRQPQVHAKLAEASGRQENPIKNWLGVFNRNHTTRPQASASFSSSSSSASATANHQVSQDSMVTTKTCSCR